MNKIPFKRFIIIFLLFNKSIQFIIEKLKDFGYFITEKEVSDVFEELKAILPASLSELIKNGGVFLTTDESHVEKLKYFGIFEFYDFILRRDSDKNPPEYFKWCSDCLWIHSYKDVMCLINILLFNNENIEEISKIITFKYKKKIGVDTIKMYQDIFWDTTTISAKDALYFCLPFRNNALVIRKMRSGESEIMMHEECDDGSDVPFIFHDNGYIKWKIGYKEVEIPDAKGFINQVKKDSYYKYYEAMNMTQSVDSEHEEGTNDRFGAFDRTLTRKKNVEEQRVKMAKNWLDIFMKANEVTSDDGRHSADDFFEKMQQLELDFETPEDEKIAKISEVPEVLKDIKADMSQ